MKIYGHGRLTDTPKVIASESSKIVSFTIAENRYVKKDEQGNPVYDSFFIDVTFFGQTADYIRQNAHKGDMVFIEGILRTESWNDKKTSEKRSKTSVLGNHFELVSKNSSDHTKNTPKTKDSGKATIIDNNNDILVDLETKGEEEIPF